MPATCQPSVQNSFYILEVIGDQIGAVRSDPISISSTSHLQIYNLPRNSFYNFSIISNNSIGEGSSLLLNFCELNFLSVGKYLWMRFQPVIQCIDLRINYCIENTISYITALSKIVT